MTADYERRTFTVSQCNWDPNAQQNIATIKSLAEQETPTRTESRHISGGTIAGIVIGSILGLAVLVGLALFLYRRYATRHGRIDEFEKPELNSDRALPPELTGNKHIAHEVDGKQYLGAEMDSKRLPGLEIDGKPSLGHELVGNAKMGHELDSGQHGSAEMPASTPASELP